MAAAPGTRSFRGGFTSLALHLMGRTGMHKYNNQDHAVITALQTAKQVRDRNSKWDDWAPFIGGLAASLSLTLYLSPPGAGTDIFLFKDAGCNLALGRGFNTFAIPGSPGLTPHLFSSYAPGFPFVFGIFSLLFGCSVKANAFFNYIVGVVASGLFWGIGCSTIYPRLHKAIVGFLVGLVGPFALVAHDGDRPETLAFGFFVVTCLAIGRCTREDAISALLAGITALIQPFAGLLALVVVWASAQARAFERKGSLDRLFSKRSLEISAEVVLLALIPIAITACFYVVLDPTAPERFFGHAAGPLKLISSSKGGYVAALNHAFSSSGANSKILVSSYISSIILCAMCLQWRNRRTLSIPVFAFLTTFITVAALPIALFPYQNNYMKLVSVALPVIVILSPRLFLIDVVHRRCSSSLVMLVVFFAGMGSAMGIVHRWGAWENYKSASKDVSEFSNEFGHDMTEVVLLDNPGVYFMYKPYFPRLANVWHLTRFYQSSEIKALIACRMGKRPDEKIVNPSTIGRRGVQLMKTSAPFRPAVFGVPLTSSDWSWQCEGFRLLSPSRSAGGA